jgi:hypothetical protein
LEFISAHSVEGSTYTQGLWTQVEVFLSRSYLNASRNRGLFLALILQNLQYLFYGLLFVGMRIYGQEETAEDNYQRALFSKNFCKIVLLFLPTIRDIKI